MQEFQFKNIIIAISFFFGLLIIGTTGFVIIEGFNIIEAVYMTVNTMSTVGFGEVHELSTSGRVFTSILIIVSFGIFAYVLTTVTQNIVDGRFRQ